MYGQGKNADALAQYFGEDPARCPCEQGKLIINMCQLVLFTGDLFHQITVHNII
jgi:hypothetical protein